VIGVRHASVQRLRRLSRRRSVRAGEGAFVIDGPTLLDEALDAGLPLDEVFAEAGAPRALLDRAAAAGAIVHQVHDGVLAKATDTVTPQAVAAIARFADLDLAGALGGLARPELVLVLAGVSTPGNAGTLLRSAEASGAEAVVFSDDAVDPYNPKCVRSAAGALFRLRVVRSTTGDATVAALRERGIRSLGTVARDGVPYDEIDMTVPVALVLGSEAHGLPPKLEADLDTLVTIPMRGGTESLNVGMAGTIICFEALRQRRSATAATAAEAASDNPLDDRSSPGAGFSAA
jgi:TrmH family RNA methyltransferase